MEAHFEYSTGSGTICIQKLKLLILLILMCVGAEYKEIYCGGSLLNFFNIGLILQFTLKFCELNLPVLQFFVNEFNMDYWGNLEPL